MNAEKKNKRGWRISSVRERIGSSLRLKLLVTVGGCLVVGAVVYSIAMPVVDVFVGRSYVDYTENMNELQRVAEMKVRAQHELNDTLRQRDQLAQSGETLPHYPSVLAEMMKDQRPSQEIADAYAAQYTVSNEKRLYGQNPHRAYIVDIEGKLLFRPPGMTEERVDLQQIVMETLDSRKRIEEGQAGIYVTFHAINVWDKHAYLVFEGTPQGVIKQHRVETPFAIALGLAVALLAFLWLSRRKMREFGTISASLLEIAAGKLDTRVPEQSRDELGQVAMRINHMAAELKRRIEEERRVEAAKNELITNVSHDLRTPLTSILGYLRLLQDGKAETAEDRDRYLGVAVQKSETLQRLIDDLFEYTKLTADGYVLARETVHMNGLLEQLVEELRPAAEEAELTIKLHLPEQRVNVQAAPDKLGRVFENLLGNALKYSRRPGEVVVTLSTPAEGQVQVVVSNEGEPIPEALLPRLFERFYRTDQARSAEGGSGLGLAIAKSIVELHGGTIVASCEADTLTFTVTWPASPAHTPE